MTSQTLRDHSAPKKCPAYNGAIYQAGNWLHLGVSGRTKLYVDKHGKEHHSRTISPTGFKKQYGVMKPCLKPEQIVRVVTTPGKYLYAYPFERELRQRLAERALAYPSKICVGSVDSDTPADLAGEGGTSPTPALQ